eukprot:scaffold293637_cov20-Prasinocladus_malaysianus.AAC.1
MPCYVTSHEVVIIRAQLAQLDEAEGFCVIDTGSKPDGVAARPPGRSYARVSYSHSYNRTPGFTQRHNETSISKRIDSPHSETCTLPE